MQSRYVPLTQQRYCCVPTSLLMVMYRHGLPLLPQDELGYALGLTVPEEDVSLFSKARTGMKPLSGWGTQIQNPKFEINKVLASLDIPLQVDVRKDIKSIAELRKMLETIAKKDGDALLCFDYGMLWNEDRRGGHVAVFDHLEGGDVWIVDPLPNVPKLRRASLTQLFRAIDFHGPQNSCGVWVASPA